MARCCRGSYAYKVTSLNSRGESNARTVSLPAHVSLPGSRVTIKWAAIDGAEGYRVYRSTGAGGFGLLATVESGTTAFTDTGSDQPGEAPLTANSARTPGQWRPAFGGVMRLVSRSPGYFRDLSDAHGHLRESHTGAPPPPASPLRAAS